MEHHQIDCTPFGFTATERRFLKKKKEPFFSEKEWMVLKFISVLFLLSALLFFVTTVFHLTDTAHADEVGGMCSEVTVAIGNGNYHVSEETACEYLQLYPERVKNLAEAKKHCV